MANQKKILVTGGCGFIGSNFVRHVIGERPEWAIVNLDALTYAGNPMNLSDMEEEAGERYRFEEALDKKVEWYLPNMDWVNSVRSGDYREWIARNYGNR